CRNGPIDLVFIVDSSRSVRPTEFEKAKEFLQDLVDSLEVGLDSTRVGLVNYASTVRMEFPLKAHFSKPALNALARVEPLASGTMTGLAIRTAVEKAFAAEAGARLNSTKVARVAVVVTDGRPQDEVERVSAAARESGIEIYAVGVDRADRTSLRLMASQPHEDHVFYVETYGVIEKLTSRFRETLCGLDACAEGHSCQHLCVDHGSSRGCECRPGFVLNPDRRTCSRSAACVRGHGCQHVCVRNEDLQVCLCHEGHVLNADQRTCSRIDPCARRHDCQHICISNHDSYVCQCPAGHVLNPDNKTCSRLDACVQGHHCQHRCVSSGNSYVCRCRPGYSLNTDRKTCTPPSEELRSEIAEDACMCEAQIRFQEKVQAAFQDLNRK
uniref:Matrilin 3b n=1 Tax=Tetraodon nigroviridis TaxID=99883 RepID=H3DN58_TETNG